MPNPPTLSDLLCRGAQLFIGCKGCKRSVYIEGSKALQMFGPDRTLAGVAEVAKCSVCGTTSFGLNVDTADRPR